MNYYDSNPQDLDHIYTLIKDAETKLLKDQLYKCTTKFLKKI